MFLVFFLLLSGCSNITARFDADTDYLRGEARKQHAAADVLKGHEEIAKAYATCLLTIPNNASAKEWCGEVPQSPVSMAAEDSRKSGEVSQFQLVPPVGAMLGAIVPFIK